MALKMKIAAGVGVLGVAVAGLAIAAPAHADTVTQCRAGYACVWGDGEYKTLGDPGRLTGWFSELDDFSGLSYGNNFTPYVEVNDSATSVYNNGNTTTNWYYLDSNQRGFGFRVPIHSGDAALSNSVGVAPGGFNDRLSSGVFRSN